jgi:hypothetical protein
MQWNRFHKNFFLVLLVVAPLYWLMLTDDGTRRVDAVMLWLLGKTAMDFNLAAIDARFTPAELQTVFPQLEWNCQKQSGYFGDQVCASPVGTFNGIPARYIFVFFNEGQASGLKMEYRSAYHDQLVRQVSEQLGTQADVRGIGKDEILEWQNAGGRIILKAELGRRDEAALLWISRETTLPRRPPG